ncbi:hypothetical protein L596_015333 [Steinernema carpocapsae]|uniref:Saposin B-type domain-containing protein n=1 Tax=Steinernema carpocapsae TaxID=34508 RepID=A0A4U5NEP0_STECR|nr:hypothetical protein L596_015333 [Steinernema carpocapsae]
MKTFVLLIALFALLAFAWANDMPDLCKSCENLVSEGQKAEEYSDQWLKSHISEICQKFGKLEKICTEVLSIFSALIDKSIKKEVSAQKACSSMQLC